MSTCNLLDTRILTDYVQKSPQSLVAIYGIHHNWSHATKT